MFVNNHIYKKINTKDPSKYKKSGHFYISTKFEKSRQVVPALKSMTKIDSEGNCGMLIYGSERRFAILKQ